MKSTLDSGSAKGERNLSKSFYILGLLTFLLGTLGGIFLTDNKEDSLAVIIIFIIAGAPAIIYGFYLGSYVLLNWSGNKFTYRAHFFRKKQKVDLSKLTIIDWYRTDYSNKILLEDSEGGWAEVPAYVSKQEIWLRLILQAAETKSIPIEPKLRAVLENGDLTEY